MNKNVIFAIILAILILISAVQAVQLTTLKSKIDAGSVKIAGTKTTVQSSTGGASSVNDLPTMVGGC